MKERCNRLYYFKVESMERKSNFELLRIILFFMVVIIHVTGVGLGTKTINFNSFNWHYANILESFSRGAVNGFILITGFFMCNKEINIKSNLKKLILPVLFYLIFYFYLIFENNKNVAETVKSMIITLSNSTGHFHHFWYLQTLVALIFLMPFINRLLSNLSKKEHFSLIIVLFILTIGFTSINTYIREGTFNPLLFTSRVSLFAFLYIIGAYIQLYKSKITKTVALLGYIACSSMVAGLTYLYNINYLNKTKTYQFITNAYEYDTALVFFAAVSIFIIFAKLDFSSKIINYISKYTYGAYIIHNFYIVFLQRYFSVFAYTNKKYYFILDFCYVILVGISSLLTEGVRQAINNKIKLINVRRDCNVQR